MVKEKWMNKVTKEIIEEVEKVIVGKTEVLEKY